MAGSCDLKHYHDEAHCCKGLMETYFSQPNNSFIEDCMGFPMRKLHEFFSKGMVTVKTALDISFGAMVSQLFSLSNVCKEIYVLQLTKNSMEQFKQWLEKGDKATDWSYASKRVCHLEGNRQGWEAKEDQARGAIKLLHQWEDYETTDIDPSLVPEVDCVMSLFILLGISKTKEEFERNLKKFTSRLKCGGYLVLVLSLNITFYSVGDHRFFALSMSEIEVQESLIRMGFSVEESETIAAADPCHTVDYTHNVFISARKIRK